MYSIHARRPDFAASEVVEAGIEMGDHGSLLRAACYLGSHGLPPALIARVLNHPELRRNVGRLLSRETQRCEEASRFKFLA